MNHTAKLFILLSVLSGFNTANASPITYERRPITTSTIGPDYKDSWNNQSSIITSDSPSDFNNLLGGNETFSHLAIALSTSVSHFTFQIAPDAGYGGALYFDNTKVSQNVEDLWWDYDWNKSNEILSYTFNNLSGNHLLDVYWAENCCNGGNSARFSLDGGSTWQNASVENINALPAAVPVPATIWLFGSGIAGLIGLRRNKKTVGQLTVA